MAHRTHLEFLLHTAMLRAVPDIVHDCCRQWQGQGYKGNPDRTSLVEHLLRAVGPVRFLQYCEIFPSYAPTSPLFFLLYNSSTPGSLVRKISHHSAHFHPTRRLELVEEGDDYIVVEDIVFASPSPAPADDMFVCSTLKGVLLEYGCRGIRVEWEAVRSEKLQQILTTIGIRPRAIEQFTRWRYRWESIERSCRIDGMDEYCLEKIHSTEAISSDSLLFRLRRLLSEDLTRKPAIEVTAVQLELSPRSLQRRLKAEGTSYNRMYNELRIKAAERLLISTSMTLAEISRTTGFSDNAHLCREFNKKHLMTPNSFRQLVSSNNKLSFD